VIPPAATTQPGALEGAGLRRVVTVLSVTQITSWGVLYYAFAALSSSITTDTGWSSIQVTGAFSVAQLVSAAVGIWVGRHIDRVGPRLVMTVGSLVAVPGVVAIATAPTLPIFYVGWVVTGVAMAAVLYPPAFAALTRWGGDRRVGALTTLTLVAGLASTVFAPLASVLDDWLDWRGAYLVLLAGLVVITVPLHWWGLRPRWVAARHHDSPLKTADTADRMVDPTADVRAVVRSRPFLLLAVAMALTSLAVFAVVINLVPMLVEQGMTRNLAAVALGLGGVGQVAGRLGYSRFAARTTVTVRTVVVVAAVAVATAALSVAGSSPALLIGLGILVGLARGIFTLIQATAITDRWGPAAYGTLNGVLTAPSLVASASAPFIGAALAHVLGSYAHAFLVLAGLAGVAAILFAYATPHHHPSSHPTVPFEGAHHA
jgi:MFS family permease